MRDCGAIIDAEITRRKVKRKSISEYADMSPQNLSKVLKKKTFDAGTLEKFCQYLGLDPMSFFDYRPGYCAPDQNSASVQDSIPDSSPIDRESELMEKLLNEKDARIKNLELTVSILLGKLKTIQNG